MLCYHPHCACISPLCPPRAVVLDWELPRMLPLGPIAVPDAAVMLKTKHSCAFVAPNPILPGRILVIIIVTSITYLTLPYLTLPYLTLPYLTLPNLT